MDIDSMCGVLTGHVQERWCTDSTWEGEMVNYWTWADVVYCLYMGTTCSNQTGQGYGKWYSDWKRARKMIYTTENRQ